MADGFWMIKLLVSVLVVSTLVSVCDHVCLSVMMIVVDPCWCEPFWCEPYGSWWMVDVMRYVFFLCLCVCLYVYLAFHRVNLATLALHT